jgi:FkbM family methyltransferase
MPSSGHVIYDFGANNGDNIAYYLRKPYRVVAVEANPALCRRIEERYAEAVASGRLVVVCCVISTGPETGEVPFYLHKRKPVLSQFPKPAADKAARFDEVALPALSPVSIIARHGTPHYIKIDLEHYDAAVLRSLFEQGIFPDYISAEAHTVEVFCLLVAAGNYRAFKLVDGRSVSTRYANHPIATTDGINNHIFPSHSAGPYGNDIDGPWCDADQLFRQLAEAGLGWKDIHASRHDAPSPPAPKPPAQSLPAAEVISGLWHRFLRRRHTSSVANPDTRT